MSQNNWISSSGSSWSVAADWSLGTVPTFNDNVVFASGFSNFGCTVNQAAQVASIVTSGTYGGALTFAGQTLTSSGNVTFDGSGTLNLGNGVTCNGASSNFHIGSTVGTVTATSCAVTFNGTTACVLDIDKATTIAGLVLGASAVVTSTSAATVIISNTVTLLTIGAGATLTLNSIFSLRPTASMAVYSQGAASTFNGTGAFGIRLTAAGIDLTLPATTYTGSGAWSIYPGSAGTCTLTGDLNLGSACNLDIGDLASATFTFSSSTYNITCGQFVTGSAGVTTATLNYGSGTHTITSFRGDLANTNATALNLQTSIWTCTGNWTFGSNHTVTLGTSVVNITNTSTVTSNNKAFYDLNINTAASGTLVTFADSPKISGDFTVTQGSTTFTNLNWSGYGDVLFDGTGNHTIGSGITMMGAGTMRLNGNLTSVVSAGCYIKAMENTTFNLGTRTINRLGLTSGKTVTMTAGAPILTVNSYTAADWDGVTFVSSTPTSRWGLKMVPSITTNNVNVTDSDNSTGTQIISSVTNGNVDGGNNLNWLFTAIGGAAAELIEMRFYNPFLHKYYIKKARRVLRAVQRYIGS